jgi:hypothetical protein
MGLKPERKNMDQPRPVTTPLQVAAKASVGVWPKAVVDRPMGLGEGAGRRRGRGGGELRCYPQQHVTVGGVKRRASPSESSRHQSCFPCSLEVLLGENGTASGDRVDEGGRMGCVAVEVVAGVGVLRGEQARLGCVVAGARVASGEGRSWGPGERELEKGLEDGRPEAEAIACFRSVEGVGTKEVPAAVVADEEEAPKAAQI